MQNRFPEGIYKFNRNKIINFELNRWHAFGLGRLEDLKDVSKKLRTIEDNKPVFRELARKAENEGRLKNAAIYYHAAEFYIPRDDPDKSVLYDNFRRCFYAAFKNDNIEQVKIPYAGSYLHAIRLKPGAKKKESRGTILFHGGFDSLLEELYNIIAWFRDQGYDVIGFEGPGQGYTLRHFGLSLDHDWEKPTAAVLDYFKLDAVTMIGASLGGYWCLRAAAFEPRIKQVIAYGLVYDFMAIPGKLLKKITEWLLKNPRRMESSIKLKMKLSQNHRWITNHWAFITGAASVGEVPQHMLRMNQEHMHPEKITQDVLLLTGEDDEFFPARLLKKQEANLSHASSVTSRVFTKEENASSHCQIGNVGLAMQVIANWLEEKK